jgi:hypothetical protein
MGKDHGARSIEGERIRRFRNSQRYWVQIAIAIANVT